MRASHGEAIGQVVVRRTAKESNVDVCPSETRAMGGSITFRDRWSQHCRGSRERDSGATGGNGLVTVSALRTVARADSQKIRFHLQCSFPEVATLHLGKG